MLVPKILPTNFTDNASKNILEIKDTKNIKADLYNTEILYDEKARQKFIKRIESIIRRSIEYKSYIGFLKNELDLTKCTFLPSVDVSKISNITLEFHHYPFTLYDIVSIVLDQYIITEKKKLINPFDIAEEIMKLHYSNYIGLVPLSKTVHKLVHSGKIFINLKYVFGNYKKFMSLYEAVNNENYSKLYATLEKLSNQENKGEKIYNKEILSRYMLELNIDDIEKPKEVIINDDDKTA